MHHPDSNLEYRRQPKRNRSSLRITVIYLVTGALWILFSDQILAMLVTDPATLTRLGIVKGWGYILVTAGLLYVLIRRHETTILRASEALEQRVEERTSELSTLLAVSHTVTSTLELEPLLSLILELLEKVVDWTGASVLIPEGDALIIRAHHGAFSQDDFSRLRFPVQQALPREVMVDQRPVLIPDVWRDTPQSRGFRAWISECARVTPPFPMDSFLDDVRSWIAVPLVVKGQTIGMLTLSDSEPDRYSLQDARLVKAFADQVAVAIENARLHEQAERLAVMEERQRLARELHDSVTQALYSVTLYAEATRMALSAGKQDVAADNLQELYNMAREAMLDMRMLIFELHPPVLEEEGLIAALQARLASVEARAGLETEIHVEGERRLQLSVEEELFWIALEAFNNVVKHAHAQQVAVRLAFDDQRICMEISDDGRGFDLAEARHSGGMGLQGMEERVQRIGGQLKIVTAPGEGTTLRVKTGVA